MKTERFFPDNKYSVWYKRLIEGADDIKEKFKTEEHHIYPKSIFGENSIAVTGLRLKGDILQKFKEVYFLLDNDLSANKKVHKLLDKRSYVFNWKKVLKDYKGKTEVKDVNDFILNNTKGITILTWDIISPYFTNKISDKIYFPLVDNKDKI
jgi:hypothetical protein